jgi:ornithine cyclodeaminase
MIVLGRDFVRTHLTYDDCIALIREAMMALSRGETLQPLRSILRMEAGRMFGVMPGALGPRGVFGAKLVSVFPGNAEQDLQSHQGGILLFEPEAGRPVALVHAGEVTAIRTAAASAAATDALARRGASRLAVLGCGEQGAAHIEAISKIRTLSEVTVWGRSFERTQAFARRMGERTGHAVEAVEQARDAVANADIVCTVTSSADPVLLGSWLAPGTHVNLVGSSYAGPVEVDHDLVANSRFIADHRAGVLAQGAEFLAAREAGLIDDSHVVGEIGQVYAGDLTGRETPDQVTVYKSLGHVVQDLASAQHLYERALEEGVQAAEF